MITSCTTRAQESLAAMAVRQIFGEKIEADLREAMREGFLVDYEQLSALVNRQGSTRTSGAGVVPS